MTIIADQVFAPGERVVRGTSVAVKVVAAEGREGAIMIPGTMHSVQGRIEMRVDPETGIAAINLEPNTGTPANNYYQWITQVPGTPPVVRNFEAPESPTSSTLTSGVTLPASTIPVADATSFAAATPEIPGLVSIGGQIVLYTGKTGTTLTGATGGEGTFALGTTVTQGYWVGHVLIDPPASLPTFLSELLEDEIADRIAAVSAEASARAAAIAAEAATRADVDADLLADLTSEVNRATAEEADLAADIVSEATARAAAVTAEATTREAADAAELLARSTGALAQYRPVSGGASTTLPADLVLPTDGSTFDLPLVTLTNPAAMTESWTVVDPDLIAGSDGDAIQTFTPAKGVAFTQATSAKRPTIRRNVLDGHSTLRADGVDDAMAQAAGAAKAQPNTYLAIAKATETTQTRRLLDSLSGSTQHILRINASKWEIGAGVNLVGGAVTGNWRSVVGTFNGASSSLALDGGTATTGDAGAQAPTGLTLFSNSGQSTQFWQGDLAYGITLATANAATILAARRWLAEQFPSVPVLAAAEKPTNAWYPEGYVQVGANAVLHYTGKTANKLTGCKVVVGTGTVASGAAVTQARVGNTDAASVRTVQAVPLVGANLSEQLGEVVSHLNEQGVNVARAPYFASPVQTPLYNSDAINAAKDAIYAANGELGGKITIPRYTAPLLVDPTTGSGVAANRKSLILNRPNIELHILAGCTVKPAIQTVDQYDVVFAGYGGGLGYGCTLRVDGRLLGDLRGRTVQSPGGPQTGHTIRLGGHIGFRICGTGTIGESWGDLLYVGEDPDEPDYRRSSGLIVASKLLWTEARREAFGAFNGDDMTFLGLRITDVGKLANAQGVAVPGGPQRGFDCEPNVSNPLRPEAVRHVTIVWAKISGCYGAGFVLGGGQGAVCDTVSLGLIETWDNGLSANFSNDEGIVLSHATNLQADVLKATNHIYGAGVEVKGDCSGHIESIVSTGNLIGFRSDTANGTLNPSLSYGSIRARLSLQRDIDFGVGRDDAIVQELDSYGGSQSVANTDPPVRIAGSTTGGKLRITSGRIRLADEEQEVRITGSPTGGTWTATFDGQTTAAIVYNATRDQVRAAIEALSNVGVGNASVSGGQMPAFPVVVRFVGTLGGTNQPQMTVNGSGLTGGTSPAVAVSTLVPGGGNPNYLLEVATGTGHEINRVSLEGTAGALGQVLDSGIGTIIRNCPGYQTAGKGEATIPSGSTFVEVPHGSARKMVSRDINVKPTNNLGTATKWWVSHVGPTTFRINVDVDPGATGAKFSWSYAVETGLSVITAAHLTAAGDGTDLAAYSTATFALSADRLGLAWVRSIVAAGTPNTPTIAGWDLVDSVTVSTRRLSLLRRMGAAEATSPKTIDFAAQTQTGCAWSFVELSGARLGSNGASAIGGKATGSGTGTSSLATVAFTAEGSATVGGTSIAANEGITPGTGFTELGDSGHSNPTARIFSQWRQDQDESVDASWTTPAAWLSIAVEVLAAG